MGTYQIKKPASVKSSKRVGRGTSSGHGKTSCRGQKGQGSRSGFSMNPGFEGGQMPLQRRLPKRGFNNSVFTVNYEVINILQLAKLDVETVNKEVLFKVGLIKIIDSKVKILGNGEITKAIKVIADKFSETAASKIVKAGGEVEVIKEVKEVKAIKNKKGSEK
jgi:large subunit ribosomal protein L15